MPKSDWLDSQEFKDLLSAYWVTCLSKYERIDDLRLAIRKNYCPTTRKIREQAAWIDTLTGEKR